MSLAARGLTAAQMAAELGVAKSTVLYHLRRLGSPPDERFNRRYDWAEVQRFYGAGNSARACMARFGFASQTWQAARRRGDVMTRPTLRPIETYLVNGRRVNRPAPPVSGATWIADLPPGRRLPLRGAVA